MKMLLMHVFIFRVEHHAIREALEDKYGDHVFLDTVFRGRQAGCELWIWRCEGGEAERAKFEARAMSRRVVSSLVMLVTCRPYRSDWRQQSVFAG